MNNRDVIEPFLDELSSGYVELGPYLLSDFEERVNWDLFPFESPLVRQGEDENIESFDTGVSVLIRFTATEDGWNLWVDVGPEEYDEWDRTVSEELRDYGEQELVLNYLAQVLKEMEDWTEEATDELIDILNEVDIDEFPQVKRQTKTELERMPWRDKLRR